MEGQEASSGGGRARGRARGRSRMGPEPAGEPLRRPGVKPPQSIGGAIPKSQPRPGQSEAHVKPIARGRSVISKSKVAAQTGEGDIAEKMGSLHLGEGRTAGETSRGAVRKRPFEEFVKTRPPTAVTKIGTSGKPVTLHSNFFKLATHTDWALYQYRVDFQPDEDRTIVRKALLRTHKDTLGVYMFDGSVLYTINKLHPDPLELFSLRKGDDLKIRVIIKQTTDLALGDPHYVQFFNIVLRKCLAALNLQLVGRDYYDAQSKVAVKEFNFEVWPGIITSIRQHEQSILLNVDISHKVMRQETAFDLLKEMQHRDKDYKALFEQAIIGSTVITLYNNKTYRVDDVDWEHSPKTTFNRKDGDISFMDYYRDRYQIRIYSQDQPLLVSRPKARDIRGGRPQMILLVPELCNLTGLTDQMRNNFHLMRALAEFTRVAPLKRMEKYKQFMHLMNSNKGVKDELSLWNIKFVPNLIEFKGRILQSETVFHGSKDQTVIDKYADWTRELRGKSMFVSGTLNTWAIIFTQKMSDEIKIFVRTLLNASNSLKFHIPEPIWEEIQNDRSSTYVNSIEMLANRRNPQLIMCIVPNNRSDRYSAIKKKCCIDRPIPSQVVLGKNLCGKGGMSIATKIAIQMNCKIGGAPWAVKVPFPVTAMIIGFDVCHDTMAKSRSFGAMVASLNSSYSRYYSALSAHTNGEELSNDLAVQITKAVCCFKEINKHLPSKIIIYRDGVGEGNIPYVFNHEVALIRAKLKEVLYQDQELQMLFIIVSKRINTRIFLNNNNPPPGTVADDIITQPDKYDFFLVSQSVKQGTVSPTSYNVIHDNTGLTPDIVQRLTYKLTHMYYNWSGTVRVPAPCQYAHKLAFLVAQHLHRDTNKGLENLLYFL